MLLSHQLSQSHTHTLIWLDGWMRTPCEGMSEWSLWCRRFRRCVSSVIKVPASSASGIHCLSIITISKIITITIIILSQPSSLPSAPSSFPTWSLLSSSGGFASPVVSNPTRWSLVFIFGFPYGSSAFHHNSANIVQLRTAPPASSGSCRRSKDMRGTDGR